MTNTEIIQKLNILYNKMYVSNFEEIKHLPKEILVDFDYAVTLHPTNSKIPAFSSEYLYKKEKSYVFNGFLKLIFDYYLAEFCFDSAMESEVGECIDMCSDIIDFLCYKGIPYKDLMQKKLVDSYLSVIYHIIRTDLTYTYLTDYVQASKSEAYACLLKILIKNKQLKIAESFYKKYSFYISPKFLWINAVEYLKSDVRNFSKSFCQLLLTEFDKLNNSFHENEEEEEYGTTYSCLYIAFVDLMIKCFCCQNPCFPNGCTLNEVLTIGIECFKGQEETYNRVSSFCEALYVVAKNQFREEEVLALLRRKNSNEEETCYPIGEDVVIFLNVFLIGINWTLLHGKGCAENFPKNLVESATIEALLSAYSFLDQQLKAVIADLMDLYVNIRNYRSDYIDVEEFGEFLQKIEQRDEDLLEQYVTDLMKGRLGLLDSASVDENCRRFFDDNYDMGQKITNIEPLLQKLENKENIKKILSTGEILVLPYKDLDDDILKGDLTGLVVCQIKAVERYLKEIIVQYAKKENKDIVLDDKKILLVRKGSMGYRFCVRVDENTSALNLSDSTRKNSFSVEIGPCIEYIGSVPSISRFNGDIRSIFNPVARKSALYNNWVREIRNKHMHVLPIESLKEAKEKLAKTAYWLLRIIDELIY